MKTNIANLRDSLLASFEELKKGNLDNSDAKEITNMAGKIILSAKVEMDYNKLIGNLKKIDFLEVTTDISPIKEVLKKDKTKKK